MSQLDLFGNPLKSTSQNIGNGIVKIQNGEYILYTSFFSKAESDVYLRELRNEILWKQESMNMYGKKVNFPRLTAWYGDNDKPYSFSGITLNPHPWDNNLKLIKNKIYDNRKYCTSSETISRPTI